MTYRSTFNRLIPLTLLALGMSSPAALALTSAPIATSLHVYTPFQPAGGLIPGVAVTGKASGVCFSHSVASPARPDAYRCNVGNAILDPCFASLNDQAPLACVRDLWSAVVTQLSLTGVLPSNTTSNSDSDYSSATPWALELANGARCTFMTGATAPIAGLRINYGCQDGGVVAGGIDRSLPQWRVFYQTMGRSLSLSLMGVSVAWY